MTSERILNVFGQIDEKYIEEAAPAANTNKSSLWQKWGSLAACAAIVVLAGASLLYYTDNSLFPDSTMEFLGSSDVLPMLTSGFINDGMGFEGVMYYDISEADTANPWTAEAELTTLPVYRNLACFSRTGTTAGATVYLSDKELLELAKKTSVALDTIFSDITDVTIESTEYDTFDKLFAPSTYDELKDSLPLEQSLDLTATTNVGTIRVSGNGEIEISFSEPISLPKEYSFSDASSSEDAIEALTYLTKRFDALHDFSQPICDSKILYTYSGEQHREYYVYEGSGDIVEQILHYNFDKISFISDTNNENTLLMIRFGNLLDCAEKIGDYPLITTDTAQELLLADNYITTVPIEYLADGKIKEEHIAKVELVYHTGNLNEVFMPYYRFYVELTADDSANMAEGLKQFGAFYVPAVSGEYLSDFPVWDGNFN